MRARVVSALAIALALVMVTSVPATAAKNTTTYQAVECYVSQNFGPPARVWTTGMDDQIAHVRGGLTHSEVYVFDGDWTWVGTNDIVVNFNQHVYTGAISSWGEFSLRLGSIGDFDGSFAWGRTGFGHATGTGVGDSAGRHSKGVLMGSALPPGWEPFAGCGEDNGNEITYGFFTLNVF